MKEPSIGKKTKLEQNSLMSWHYLRAFRKKAPGNGSVENTNIYPPHQTIWFAVHLASCIYLPTIPSHALFSQYQRLNSYRRNRIQFHPILYLYHAGVAFCVFFIIARSSCGWIDATNTKKIKALPKESLNVNIQGVPCRVMDWHGRMCGVCISECSRQTDRWDEEVRE